MANMKFVQSEYGTALDILFNLDPYTAKPFMVSDEGVTAKDGKKIVIAGSILDADGKIVNDATAEYVLLKEIDVTYGPQAGAGVYRGSLNVDKFPVKPSAAAVEALSGIKFFDKEGTPFVGA